MGKQKLLLAVEAAGYAMVNPDDCEMFTRRPTKVGTSEPVQVHNAPVTAVGSGSSLAQDWFGYFLSRAAAR